MNFDLEARPRCKAALNKQALPTKEYATYVVYTLPWAPDYYYLVGFDTYLESVALMEEFRAKGRDTDISYGYPYELMYPEKKK